MSVDAIAGALEDISITPKPKAYEYTLPPSSADVSELDKKTIELMELVYEYEEASEKISFNYSNGFLTLSRANYNSGITKKYGAESLDMRPYESYKVVRHDVEFILEDRNSTRNTKEDPEKVLKNRKEKKQVQQDNTTRNPIYQFGGIVPYQLRQSQKYFSEGLQKSVDMINLRARIEKVMEEIEKMKREKEMIEKGEETEERDR